MSAVATRPKAATKKEALPTLAEQIEELRPIVLGISTQLGDAREAAEGDIGDAKNSPFRALLCAEQLFDDVVVAELSRTTSEDMASTIANSAWDVEALLHGVAAMVPNHPAGLAANHIADQIDALGDAITDLEFPDRADSEGAATQGAAQEAVADPRAKAPLDRDEIFGLLTRSQTLAFMLHDLLCADDNIPDIDDPSDPLCRTQRMFACVDGIARDLKDAQSVLRGTAR